MSKRIFNARINQLGDHSGILRNILIVNFFFRVFTEGFRTLLVPFSYDVLGLDEIQYGLIQSIGGYAAMGAVLLLGLLVDVSFKKYTMVIGIISALLSALLFPRSVWLSSLTTNKVSSFTFSILFYCLFTIGVLLMMISTNTFIANETKKGKQRTRGFSWNMIARGIASAIAPISFTFLLEKTSLSYDWVYLIMAAFGLTAGILVIALRLKAEETPKA